MAWFESTFGAPEPHAYSDARAMFEVFERDPRGEDSVDPTFVLRSRANGAEYHIGKFSTPSVAELRDMVASGVSETPGDQCAKAGANLLVIIVKRRFGWPRIQEYCRRRSFAVVTRGECWRGIPGRVAVQLAGNGRT